MGSSQSRRVGAGGRPGQAKNSASKFRRNITMKLLVAALVASTATAFVPSCPSPSTRAAPSALAAEIRPASDKNEVLE